MNAVQTAPDHVDWINYHLREMEPKDSAAYRELMASSPDTGMITIQVIFKEDPYEMLMKRRIGQVVVVAETPEGQVVGSGAADARPIWFEKQAVQAVHMHSLMVHPDFRQKGVATALVNWRIMWAYQHYGEDVMIFAEIQPNNIASFNNAQNWASGFGQQRESGFHRVYKQPPKPVPGLTIREATESDFVAIADGLNEFNHDVNFTRYVTADRLHRNLEPIHGQVFRHRYVVEKAGEIVGGAVLSSHDPSMETRLIRAPFAAKVLARITGMIQDEDLLNGGEIDGIWFKPGYQEATHYLVDELRYRASANTSSLNFTISNPKAWEALQISHWQPHTILSVAYLRPAKLKPYVETK